MEHIVGRSQALSPLSLSLPHLLCPQLCPCRLSAESVTGLACLACLSCYLPWEQADVQTWSVEAWSPAGQTGLSVTRPDRPFRAGIPRAAVCAVPFLN